MKKKILSAVISLMLICCIVIQPLTVGAGIYTISQINVNYEGMSATSDFASTYISGMGAGYLSSDSRVKITTSSSLVPGGSGSALCVNKCDMRWWTVEAQDQNITFSVDIKIDAAFANVFTPQVISKVPSFTGNGLTTLDLFTVKRVGSSAYLCDSNGNSLKKLSEGSTYSIVCNMTRGKNTYTLLCNGSTVSSSAPLADEIYSIDSLYINVAQGTLTSSQTRRGYTTNTVYIVLDNIRVSNSGYNRPFQYSTQATGAIPTVNVPSPDYSDVRVFLNTEEISMYTAPVVTDGVLFLDMLSITTKFGMKYTLYTDGSFVIRGTNIVAQGNCQSNYITLNGKTVSLTASPVKIDGRIHVTPDFINIVTHAKVWWDEANRIFVMSTGKYMSDGILRSVGGMLYMNGEPYYEISFNKFDLFYQVMAGYVYNHEYPTADVQYAAAEKALQRLSETGFKSIRVFMHSQAYLDLMYSEEHQAVYFKAMDEVFDLCDKYGIRINMCLGLAEENLLACDYIEGEGYVQSTETVYDLIADPNSRSRQNVYNYIDLVINRYKDRDTVLMWEVNNELSLEADIGPAVGKVRCSLLQLANFYGDVADRIRAIDPEHLVTSGDSAFRPAQWHLLCSSLNGAPLDWTRDTLWDHLMALTLVNEKLDVICMHAYGINTGITDEYTYATDNGTPVVMNWQLYKDECTRLGKPFYCGETSPFITPEADANYYTKAQAYIDEIVATGIQLTHWWTFRSDRVGFNDGYTWVIDGGELHNMLIKANSKLKATHCVNAAASDNVSGNPDVYVENDVSKGLVTGNDVVNASAGATVSDVINMFFNSLSEEDVTVYNGTTAVSLGSVLSTGMTVSTSDGTSYTIIVAGDVTCDGKLDVSDISEILLHIRGDAVLEQQPLDAAAEAGGNDSINILTATAMLNILL
jgi:hypothetical protein